MITDPISTNEHAISGTLAPNNILSIEKLFDGPGAATTRRGYSTMDGVAVNVQIKHEVTKAQRRRSTFRFDAVAPVGVTALGATAALSAHSASAYIVLDRLESEVQAEKCMIDIALSSLLNTLVYSKGVALPFVYTPYLIDFMKGEP